jgi:hypothetical protein
VNDLHTQIFQFFHNVAFDRLPYPLSIMLSSLDMWPASLQHLVMCKGNMVM